MSTPSPEPFTLLDLARDAITTLREDWRAHAGWSLIWIAIATTGCCSLFVLAGVAGALLGVARHGEGAVLPADLTPMIAVVYAVLVPLMLGLYALHQAVAMEIARGRGRGTPVTMREAIERGASRTPALVLHMLLRMLVEWVPFAFVYAAAFGVLWITTDVATHGLRNLGPLAWSFVGIVYVLLIVVSFAYRAFFGLAFPCIVDGAGPYAAFSRSRALLTGRRWQFVRFRLAVMAALFLAYGLFMGPYFIVVGLAARPSPVMGMLMLPLMLGFYGAMYLLMLIDAVMEAAFHVRVTRRPDATELAKTFE